MEKDYEKVYHDVEVDHWWFKSRRKYLIELLEKVPKNSKILDIGCSSGIFLKDLEASGFDINNLYGVDISNEAIANCKTNGIPNAFVMDAQNITLTEQFDIIVASDCLEHLKDDKAAIKNWKLLLKENGRMFVFVPAFMSLWSYHDTINMHYRRYTKKQLTSLINTENLEIKESGYWNFTLFTPVYIFRKLSGFLNKDKSATSDISLGNLYVNKLMLELLLLENKLSKIVKYPFGISTFCIAEKKSKA